jgi:hypothetical protein
VGAFTFSESLTESGIDAGTPAALNAAALRVQHGGRHPIGN